MSKIRTPRSLDDDARSLPVSSNAIPFTGPSCAKTAVFAHDGPVNGIAFDDTGKLLASSSSDRGVRIFDIANKKEIAHLVGHQAPVYIVAFRPNRNTLASG